VNRTGRPMHINLCAWAPWIALSGMDIGNSWRITGDTQDWGAIYNAAQVNSKLGQFAGPGGFNDMDSLVGSSEGALDTMLPHQSRSQFSLYAILSAPLIMGVNVLNLSGFDLETYTNAEVIAISQDRNVVQGSLVWSSCADHDLTAILKPRKLPAYDYVGEQHNCQQIWAKPLHDGSYGVLFLNWGGDDVPVVCGKACLASMGFEGGVAVRDLWSHQDLGIFTDNVTSASLGRDGGSQTFKFTKPAAEGDVRKPSASDPAALLHVGSEVRPGPGRVLRHRRASRAA